MSELRAFGVTGLPEFTEGMEVGGEIAAQAELSEGDVYMIRVGEFEAENEAASDAANVLASAHCPADRRNA